ncbi:MAG: NlpC/P60 family protein [Intrasporangiaceae bacterium]|nr:NlpC/P60 family protein [Intrasporangiaceae bacterium]
MTRSTSIARSPWTIGVVVLAMLAVLGTDAGAEPTSDEARADLQAAEQRLDQLSDEFNGAVDDYNQAQEDLEVARLAVSEAEAELVVLRNERNLLAEATTTHIRQLHKLGPTIELTSLFSATAAGDAGQRTALLRRVLGSQQTDLESLSATAASLEAAEARLVEERDAAVQQAANVEEQRDRMEQTLASQQDEVEKLEVTLASAISREEAERRAAAEEARRRAAAAAQAEREAAARTTATSNATSTSTSTSPSPSTSTDGSSATSTPAPAPAPAPRANASVAVEAALAQLGKPYKWGATGPNSFDCSGLMVYAWRQAGVTLPRTSASQFANLRSVSRSDLQPGDLVFAGSPRVHHVGMYIGNGQIVHSPRAGKPVETRSMQRSDLRGFGRPG